MREALDGLEVRPERMRANLEATGGLLLAEAVSTALAERARAGGGQAADGGGVAAQPRRRAGRCATSWSTTSAIELSAEEIDRALEPAGYLGSAEAFVDRALEAHREGRRGDERSRTSAG